MAFTVLLLAVVAAIALAVGHAVTSHTEVATTWLSVPILLISAATLWTTWPRPARLVVYRAHELQLNDLIFFVREPCGESDGLARPEDYLLQLHVVVVNVGERKAVLSHIEIDGFVDSKGRTVHLPGGPSQIGGMQWVRRSGYQDGRPLSENRIVFPPYLLERDDVVVLQFRQRRGLSWGPGVQPAELRTFWEPIHDPLVRAEGRYLWRKRDRLVESRFAVPLSVAQQDRFAALLMDLTHDFTVQPFKTSWHPTTLD